MKTKELKFLLTHSSIYGLGTIVAQAVAFLMLPLYTRYLTPQDYGILEIIDTTNILLGIVVTLGIARAMSRFYYEKDEVIYRNSVISTTYIIFMGVSLLVLPIFFFASGFLAKTLFSSDIYTEYFRISFISLFLGGGLDIGLMYFRLEKKSVHYVTVSISRLVILISLNIFFIVFLQKGVIGILYSTLVTRFLYTFVVVIPILWKTRFKFSSELAVKLLKFVMPLLPSNLANTFIKQSDKFFILYFLSLAEAGLYSLTLKLGNVMHILLTIPFIMTYIPRRFEIMRRDDAKDVYKEVYTYYSFLFIFFGLTFSLFIPEVLKIMVTPKFYGASQYIPLVILSMFLFGSQYHFDFGILYSKKTKYFVYINLIVAALHILLNFILISNFGVWGAIWASVIVLGTQAILYLYVSNRYIKIDYELLRVMKFLMFAVIYYLLSIFIDFGFIYLNSFCKIILLFTFPFVLIHIGIITREEVLLIKNIFDSKVTPLFKNKKKVLIDSSL